MATTVKKTGKKSEILDSFSEFWYRTERCQKDIRQYGHLGPIPPDCVGDYWDEDYERSYGKIHPYLKDFWNERFYEVPHGIPYRTTPFMAVTGHQAVMSFFNPTDALYGASPFIESKEYRSIMDQALSELKMIQESLAHSGSIQTRSSVRNRRKNRNGQLSDDGLLLHAYLSAGHKCNSEEPYFEPLGNQVFIAKQLSPSGQKWNGSRVSRAMQELLEQVKAFPHLGNNYMGRYRTLCEERKICEWLLQIHLRMMSGGIRREFGVENLDIFEKPEDDE